MGGRKKIYEALLDGARKGLGDRALYDYVIDSCEKASSKKIVRASLLALSDPDVKDEAVLKTIYALAIRHRLDPVDPHDAEDNEIEDEAAVKRARKAQKKKKAHLSAPDDVPAETAENDA